MDYDALASIVALPPLKYLENFRERRIPRISRKVRLQGEMRVSEWFYSMKKMARESSSIPVEDSELTKSLQVS